MPLGVITVAARAIVGACSGVEAICGELEQDPESGRAVCPAGGALSEDGWSCFLPDDGGSRNPNAP